MTQDDKTTYDGGETTVRGTDISEQAAGETRLGSTETVLAAQADKSARDVIIEKGSTLLDTYRVETDAIQGGMSIPRLVSARM